MIIIEFLEEYYLAYGSNVSQSEMASRCPSAEFVGVTRLFGNKLTFKGHGVGYLTTEPNDDMYTYVAVYKVTPQDKAFLDQYEGYPNLYTIKHATVKIDGVECKAFYYEMNDVVTIQYQDGESGYGYTEIEMPKASYIQRCAKGYKEVYIPLHQLLFALHDAIAKLIYGEDGYWY